LRALAAQAAAAAVAAESGIQAAALVRPSHGDGEGQVHYAQTVTGADLAAAVKWSEKRTASAIGTPAVPTVKWDDIGGLEDVKVSQPST
jgi:SpoVK/Ycf46/Vps4 family AAA+-type ATPase